MTELVANVLLRAVVPKSSDSPNDCQDALAVNQQMHRYAVADGIATSFLPAQWATLLVEHFCAEIEANEASVLDSRDWLAWLDPIQTKWESLVRSKAASKNAPEDILFRNRFASKEPAAATFVGLQLKITPDKEGTWDAMIIGDSCLLHLRNDHLDSYLKKQSSDFGYVTEGFSSIKPIDDQSPSFISGTIQDGDNFILVTDGFAKWLLGHYEREQSTNSLWTWLSDLNTWEDLNQLIVSARHDSANPLDNDDIAIVIVGVGDEKKTSLLSAPIVTIGYQNFLSVESREIKNLSSSSLNRQIDIETAPKQDLRPTSISYKFALPISVVALLIALISLILGIINTFLIIQEFYR